MSEDVTPGFAVLYRWRIRAGDEAVFKEAWTAVTLRLKRERGALGSRLHRCDDGGWAAYAQWPSREHWEASRAQGSVDDEASARMNACIEHAAPPLPLEPEADYLDR